MISLAVYISFVILMPFILKGKNFAFFFFSNGLAICLVIPACIAYEVMYSVSGKIDHNGHIFSVHYLSSATVFLVVSLFFCLLGYYFGRGVAAKRRVLREIDILSGRQSLYLFELLLWMVCFGLLWRLYSSVGLDLLFRPRDMYVATRSGFGITFFSLGVLIKILAVVLCFRGLNSLRVMSIFVLCFLTGAKINFVFVISIFILFLLVTKTRFIRARGIFLLLLGSFFSFVLMARMTFPDADLYLVVSLISRYLAEPTANFALLLSDFSDFGFGKFFFENNFYTKIPRAFYPEKPTIFGVFGLGYMYFPEIVALGLGSPSFGLEGAWYADFRFVGLLVFLLLQFLRGFGLGFFSLKVENLSIHGANFRFSFLILMIFAGQYLVNVPPGSQFIDSFVFLIFLVIIISMRTMRIRVQRLFIGDVIN